MRSQTAVLSRRISLLLFGLAAIAQMPVLLAQVQSDSLAQVAKAKIDRLEINFKGLHGESGVKQVILGAKGSPYLGTSKPGNFVPNSALLSDEIEPNNRPEQAQVLRGPSPITLNGTVEVNDNGAIINNGNSDDIEDLFSVTTLSPGINVMLGGLSSNCDLYIIWYERADTLTGGGSLNSGTGDEQLISTDLPAGNYYIGVSIFDLNPEGPSSSPYVLTVEGDIADVNTSSLVTVETNPAGLSFTVDGRDYFSVKQVFNWPQESSHELGAGSPQPDGSGQTQFFSHWSDGGAQTHTIITPNADQTITARFSTQPLNPPSNLVASTFDSWPDANTRLDLTWKGNSDNEEGFKIERRLGTSEEWNQITVVGANSEAFSDTGLTRKTEYCYRIRAFNQSGNSGYSNEACATTLAIPDPPSDVVAMAVSSTRIDVSWKDNSDNEDGFHIQRDDNKFFAMVQANITTFSDITVVAESTHTYQLRAFNDDGISPGSNKDSAMTLNGPAGCEATPTGPNSMLIEWIDRSGKEDGYKILRSTQTTDESFVEIHQTVSQVESYEDTTGLLPNTRYHYRVRAFLMNGNVENKSDFCPFSGTTPIVTWQANMSIRDKKIGASKELLFGLAPTATDGLDAPMGEVDLPPVPPLGIFDARFVLPVVPSVTSLTDFRSDTHASVDWRIIFQAGSSDLDMEFVWDNTSLPEGSFFLKDEITGTIVKEDMKQKSSFPLTNSAINSLKIEYSELPCHDVVVQPNNWNLISVPLLAQDMTKSKLFPTAISDAFGFECGKSDPATILENGKGYWLKFDANTSAQQICGSVEGVTTIPVKCDWNIIGVYERDISADQITSEPAEIIQSPFYQFDPNRGYEPATTLQSGKGYWVKVGQDGVLVLQAGGITKATASPQVSGEIDNDWAKVLVADRSGRKVALYATNDDINLSRYELPPIPPAGIFDVRYGSGRYVERLAEEGLEINFSSAAYPLRLRVEGMIIRVKDAVDGNFLSETLASGEEIVVSDAQINAIRIEPARTATTPLVYALHQNYPNPFNPTTKITFSLPVAGKVRLTLYSLLGEKVADLIDEELNAGFHQIALNAKDYPTGVYFYQFESGAFMDLKKLVVLK